jgi:hypothetical protein
MASATKSAKKIAKRVGGAVEKIGKETIVDPKKKHRQIAFEEPADQILEGTGKALGKITGAMGGDVPEPDTSAQDDLLRRQGEERMAQESELAKRRELRKKGARGRGSLLSGSSLGVSNTLG